MIVVTAPTGNIGSQVLANILDSGERIRVIARDPSKLPARVLGRVEVVEGSHSDAAVVAKALEAADRVFWLVPGDPRAPSAEAAYVDFARPACEAFKTLGVKQVVGISALGRGWTKDAGHVTATLKMDDLIASTGVSYRALACASLMENVLRQTALIRDQGAFYWPTPGGLKEPACATRDVAAVAARLLLDPSWTRRQHPDARPGGHLLRRDDGDHLGRDRKTRAVPPHQHGRSEGHDDQTRRRRRHGTGHG